jgi:glutathione peroxidase
LGDIKKLRGKAMKPLNIFLKTLLAAALVIELSAFAFSPFAHAQSTTCPAALRFSATAMLAEKPSSLCTFEGKVVLVVNTASQCGYTPQYDGLEKIYNRYARQGFVVVGFPANDFGGQEPGKNADIAKFCKVNYGVTFPMFEKLEQPLGKTPLFAHLSKETGTAPQWNFHKYLIDRSGKVQSFTSGVAPESAQLQKAIEAAIAQPAKKPS